MKKKFLLLILMVGLLPGVVFGAYKFLPGSHILEDIGSTSKAWLGVYAKYFYIQEGGGIVIEGSSDDAYETTLDFTNPTADRKITFPNAAGTVTLGPAAGPVSFTGPTAARAFALPDAAATILTTNSVVSAAQGGTGQSSYAVGDLLYASGATALSKLADVAAGQPLLSGGVATAPAYAGYTLSGTAAQTYTFPTTTATLARTDAANTFAGTQTFSGSLVATNIETALSATTVALNADGNTTLYTVPAGKRAVLTKAVLVVGADAGSTDFTIGQAGALTDFLGTQQCDNLNAQYDAGIFMPVPNATAVLIKSYAAGTVIKAAVANQAGGATNTLYLFGFLY